MSGVRSVQGRYGANHEGLSPLLRADGDRVGHRTAEDPGHGIRVVCGVEFQPGVMGILLQQALAYQPVTYTLTDQLNQVLQYVFNRRFDALKSR